MILFFFVFETGRFDHQFCFGNLGAHHHLLRDHAPPLVLGRCAHHKMREEGASHHIFRDCDPSFILGRFTCHKSRERV